MEPSPTGVLSGILNVQLTLPPESVRRGPRPSAPLTPPLGSRWVGEQPWLAPARTRSTTSWLRPTGEVSCTIMGAPGAGVPPTGLGVTMGPDGPVEGPDEGGGGPDVAPGGSLSTWPICRPLAVVLFIESICATQASARSDGTLSLVAIALGVSPDSTV